MARHERPDVNAQIVMLCGNQIFSHGCREVESTFDLIAALAAQSREPLPIAGLYDFYASEQQKGSPLGTVPTTIPTSAASVWETRAKLK